MSFFADLVGSVAESGAKGFGEISARNQREDEARLQNELAIDRQKAAEAIRLDLEEKQRQAKQKRISDQNQAVEAATPAVTAERELSSAQKLAPSVDGNVMDIIKSKLSPEQMTKFYGVDNSPTAVIDDGLKVARRDGMYEAEDQLKEQRKITVAAVEAARRAANDERKIDQGDAKIDATIRGQDQATARVLAAIAGRSEVAANRAAGGGSKTSVAVEKLTSQKSLTLREITELREASTNAKTLAVNPDYIDAQKRLKRINELLSDKWEKDVNEDPAAPAAAPKPAAPKPSTPGGMTAIGKTPDGRIVYKTADGKQVVGK